MGRRAGADQEEAVVGDADQDLGRRADAVPDAAAGVGAASGAHPAPGPCRPAAQTGAAALGHGPLAAAPSRRLLLPGGSSLFIITNLTFLPNLTYI